MANVVIVESPSKANTIKGYLGANYKVIASKGHVRDLPKSKLGVDIEHDFTPSYINIRGKGDLIKELKKAAKKADNIFLATDPDREGEAISWHLAAVLGIPMNKAKRVSFNEITKSAVKAAIKNPRNIDMNLVNSQQARRILDRIVGYQISPFLWKNVKSGLSAGRVQSVATRLIVEREKEIRIFEPEEYWLITANLLNSKKKSFDAKFYGNEKNKIELVNEEETQTVMKNLENAQYIVKTIKKGAKQRNPVPPFITSTLQQEANKRHNFQSNRTMKTAQELYEGLALEKGEEHGLITYMRTDSLRISDEAREVAKQYITDRYGAEYYPEIAREYKSKKNAQDAHEAIRPSNMAYEPDKIKKYLTNDQYKIYKLIWDRFVASQMQSALLDTVNVDIEANGYIFKASGYTVKFPGFLSVYEEVAEDLGNRRENGENGENDGDGDNLSKKEKEPKLAELKEGKVLNLNTLTPSQHFTQPPPRYTEASLIKSLEEQGIGRPSTYAPTLTTILQRGYIERESKLLKPTPLGEVTTDIMKENFEEIVDYGFTAKIEDDFDNIEDGKADYINMLHKFYESFGKALEEAEVNIGKAEIVIPDTEIDYECENCGKKLIVKNGRFGKFAACSNYPECKFTLPLDSNGNIVDKNEKNAEVQKTDLKCELCGAEIVIRKGRYGSFYACSNYPKCKNTKPINAELENVSCPLCDSKIVKKRGKKMYFYSCEKYPECSFSAWDMPIEKKCPKCKSMMLQKKSKSKITQYCYDKECGYSETELIEQVEQPEEESEVEEAEEI